MKGRYKLTRFARFIIFLVLISPACYLAGTYYQDDINLQALKDKININFDTDEDFNSVESNQEEIEDLQEEIEDIYEEIEDLKSELSEKTLELKELKSEQGEV